MLKSKETGNVFFNQISSICLGKNISEIYNENADLSKTKQKLQDFYPIFFRDTFL